MNKLLRGNSQEVLKSLASNSVDTIITDPPYGLSFMGKKWDYDVPGIDLWKEALRVLKPGGTALVFAGSRTQHRMAVNVENAGFILKDCIMWLYGSGFPKATDISKQLDKGHERKVVGMTRTKDIRRSVKKDIEMGKTDRQGKFASGSPSVMMEHPITEPATPEAKQWNGWKSHALKPAYEPILVAMKPNDGTYAENALKHGVSGLSIDGGRVGKRFPANIILDEQTAQEAGEWSRFFYCAKASKKERNAGCEGLEENNFHSTVKPLALMEYLCKLTKTPTGGTVLDPFMGSGTTGVAVIKTGRDFVGIEISEEYFEICKARILKAKSIAWSHLVKKRGRAL